MPFGCLNSSSLSLTRVTTADSCGNKYTVKALLSSRGGGGGGGQDVAQASLNGGLIREGLISNLKTRFSCLNSFCTKLKQLQ